MEGLQKENKEVEGEELVTVTMTNSHQKPVSTRPLSAIGTVVDPCSAYYSIPIHSKPYHTTPDLLHQRPEAVDVAVADVGQAVVHRNVVVPRVRCYKYCT